MQNQIREQKSHCITKLILGDSLETIKKNS